MLRVLQARHQMILPVVIVFVRFHLVLVHGLLHTGHVTVHLERVLDLQLLIEHFTVFLLGFTLAIDFLFVEHSIVLSLPPGLLALELACIVELLDNLLFV